MKNETKYNIGGIIFGLIVIALFWIYISTIKSQLGYGLDILPLIIISVFLLIVFFFTGRFISYKILKKIK